MLRCLPRYSNVAAADNRVASNGSAIVNNILNAVLRRAQSGRAHSAKRMTGALPRSRRGYARGAGGSFVGSSNGASIGGASGGGSMLGSSSTRGRLGSSGGNTGLFGALGNGGCGLDGCGVLTVDMCPRTSTKEVTNTIHEPLLQ